MSVVSEEKQRSERSQRFPFNINAKSRVVSVVRHLILLVVKKSSVVSVVSEEKQRSERSQRFPFNSREEKQRSECSQ